MAESPRFQAVVGSTPLDALAYRRASGYLGGRDLDECLATIERLHHDGFRTGVDVFGEQRTIAAEVEAATDEYVRLGGRLAGNDPPVNLWIDLTNIGLDISEELCRHELARIAESLPAGSRLQVRAHDSSRIDRIIAIVTDFAREGLSVMPTLQANLRLAPAYAERLIEAGVPVLLVKGAFLERADVAYPWGEQTDAAFVRLANQLGAEGTEFAIGTHDPVIREAICSTFRGVCIEMLLGVRCGDARELVRAGHQVRLYVPYGNDWLRYWLRRLGEARGA
jgi:proline dehydrogenase